VDVELTITNPNSMSTHTKLRNARTVLSALRKSSQLTGQTGLGHDVDIVYVIKHEVSYRQLELKG
jgi:hypothetical protein